MEIALIITIGVVICVTAICIANYFSSKDRHVVKSIQKLLPTDYAMSTMSKDKLEAVIRNMKEWL